MLCLSLLSMVAIPTYATRQLFAPISFKCPLVDVKKCTSDVSTSCTSFSSAAFIAVWGLVAGGVGSGGPAGLASAPPPFVGCAPPFSETFVPGPRDMMLSPRSRVIGGRKSEEALVSAMLFSRSKSKVVDC